MPKCVQYALKYGTMKTITNITKEILKFQVEIITHKTMKTIKRVLYWF